MARTLRPGQRCRVLIGGPGIAEPQCVLETDELLLEAPNWTLDGRRLVLNGDGHLWTLDLEQDAPRPERVPFEDLPEINNDHVLDVDGRHVLMTAQDGHIHRGLLNGGPVERLTPQDGAWHFLHGISPDGRMLAYVELRSFDQPGRVVLLDADGSGEPVPIATGLGHIDGPEWTPDGAHLVCNAEGWDARPGHAQLTRIVPGPEGEPERLVVSESVDWFPHIAPDGRHAAYISFPSGTLGHPEDLDVTVTVVRTEDWSHPVQRYGLFGGQGTLNVNSWAPDGERFAFVAYPVG